MHKQNPTKNHVRPTELFSRRKGGSMHIITRFEVTDAHCQAIGQALGLSGPASREQVRTYLENHGKLHLIGLTLPLMAQEAMSFSVGR